MSYLGIDIGSSGTKAIAVSQEGKTIGSAYKEYALSSPHEGWYEIDPRDLVFAVRA